MQDLRIAIERGEHPVDDPCDVVETYLELSLRLHARDAQVHPAEPDVGADIQLQQVQHLGLQRDMGPQVLDVQIDLVDLQHRNIEIDVGVRIGDGRITLFVLFAGFRLLVVRLEFGVRVGVLGVEFAVEPLTLLKASVVVPGVAAPPRPGISAWSVCSPGRLRSSIRPGFSTRAWGVIGSFPALVLGAAQGRPTPFAGLRQASSRRRAAPWQCSRRGASRWR
ncbi:hypothetical protein ACFW2D_21865 [Streptomyces sp. NPDC058914]|uniref:hypothetical protein n=1 Tax=Streptomyces TaxID=1883 RepID=UPI0036C3B1D6